MGAKPGRMKGNKQKAKYRKPDQKNGKPGGREGMKTEESKEEDEALEKPLRGEDRKKGKEETEG